ncbi:glycosyltransferase family 4 protein [Nocardia sp. KC 131]|uniref:glycosyltransferase family 4 protein n=1 Tax=Nocardia arseniciresistens TaxID=3392119 RepID=UPI00398F3BCA
MTKALFLAHTAAPSGAELATLRLLAALRELGRTEVTAIFTEDGPMVERMRARGIETRVLQSGFDSRAMTIGSGPFRLLAGFLALLRLGWTIGATAKSTGTEVLVAESSKALVMGAVAARRAGIPLVWQVHDRIAADYFGRVPTLVLHTLGRLVAAGYIANSKTTLATLRTGRSPAIVAYPGVEFGTDTTPEHCGDQREPEETVVAVVGRLSPWKGQDVLLRAAAAAKVRPRRILLIGGTFFDEEPYRAELEQLAHDLALPVTFTGHVEDPNPHLHDADILVHCSVLPEPFGQVVVEGMHAGCAVIATGPGGPAEIVEPGVSGLLVDGGDEKQLTAALDTLIENPDLRTRLSAAGRARARHFDVDESARTVADFLDTLTRRTDAAGHQNPEKRTPSVERNPHV